MDTQRILQALDTLARGEYYVLSERDGYVVDYIAPYDRLWGIADRMRGWKLPGSVHIVYMSHSVIELQRRTASVGNILAPIAGFHRNSKLVVIRQRPRPKVFVFRPFENCFAQMAAMIRYMFDIT